MEKLDIKTESQFFSVMYFSFHLVFSFDAFLLKIVYHEKEAIQFGKVIKYCDLYKNPVVLFLTVNKL